MSEAFLWYQGPRVQLNFSVSFREVPPFIPGQGGLRSDVVSPPMDGIDEKLQLPGSQKVPLFPRTISDTVGPVLSSGLKFRGLTIFS